MKRVSDSGRSASVLRAARQRKAPRRWLAGAVVGYLLISRGSAPLVGAMEMAVSAERLILPIREVSGNIWVLENVDR